MIILRDYQLELKNAIYNSWNAKNRNVLAVLPTGGGKSVIVSDIVLDYHNIGQRCAVIAHRNELVTQMSSHIARRGLTHRIIGSGHTIAQTTRSHREEFGKSFINPSAETAVVGVDTLMSRKDDLESWARQIDCWVIDECHHITGNERIEPNKWGRAVQMFKNARGLGVTATPSREDGQGLGVKFDGVFDSLVSGPTTRYLIETGSLSDYEIVCPASDLKTDEIKLSKNGDWSNSALRKASKNSKIVGDVVQNYIKYALNRRAIVFATDIETSAEIATQFNEAGIRAASLNGKSPLAYREQTIKNFASGKIQVLINVDLFDEGFDVPVCDVIIMARPTASLGKYLQMIGRCLRPLKGKTALIIDHVSNVIRHGLPDKDRFWTLERRDKRAKQVRDPEEIELTTCRKCLKPYEKFRILCPYCGFNRPLPEPRSRSIEMVEGDLVLLDKVKLSQMRNNIILENAADVGDRVAKVAGVIAGKGVANRQLEKITAHDELSDSIAQWAAIERAKGFNDREIYRKFYLTLGVDVLTALNSTRKRKEIEILTKTIRSWYLK